MDLGADGDRGALAYKIIDQVARIEKFVIV
jgi:hypothetical protein